MGTYATVRLLPEPEVSSVLHVLKSADPTQRAEVLAVGSGIPDLQPGQTVLCRPLQGLEVGDQMVIPSTGILAVIDDA